MCPADPADPHRQRVLVVEPEPIVHDFITTALYRAGYSVIAAQDGHQAGHLFHRHALELAVMLGEIFLPGLSGLEFCFSSADTYAAYSSGFYKLRGEPHRQTLHRAASQGERPVSRAGPIADWWPHKPQDVALVRDSLRELAKQTGMPQPDDGIVRRVLDVGPRRTRRSDHAVLVTTVET